MLTTLKYWLAGIRIYIALISLVVTGGVIWWAHTMYGGTVLYPTRVEETFAWLATGLMGLAVSIGPVYKLSLRLPGRGLLFDARRLIGISAAWFASLHVVIAYGGLFKFANPLELPSEYKRSFLIGLAALLILLALTVTSFDRAIRGMGIWWFRLHRLIYVAIALTLLHAFMSGVHATELVPLSIITGLTAVLIGLYCYLSFVHSSPTRWQLLTIIAVTVLAAVIIYYGFMQYQQSGIPHD